MNPTRAPWKLPSLCLFGLLAGGLLGWLAGGKATIGIAAVAVAEVVFLLLKNVHPGQGRMAVSAPDASFQQRSRRLAASLRDLRHAADSATDAVVLLDDRHRVQWFNRAAEELLGLQRPRDRGIRLDEHLATSELAAWLGAGAAEPLADVPAPGKPGTPVHVSMMPLGQRQHVLLARDISHLTRLEQVRRDFVANVSHELRTPLTVIHGYLELIDEDALPELAPVLGEMRAQSRRMGQIVEDLLALSRLETQDRIVEERVRMTPMLATLRKEAEALSQGRHRITLTVDSESDLLGSAKDLHSALSNLVSNAVRYTPTGGSIAIRWQPTAEGAAYSVSDTGFGIAASHLARLTERFYRVSSSRSRDSGGTGLGLSIVKHVLGLHQARLTIESTPGQGSTFTCHFGAARLLGPAAGEESDGAA